MKRILSLLFLFIALSRSFSQVNDNCVNAIPLCSTPNFTFFANSGSGTIVDFSTTHTLSNPVNNPFPPNAGCLKSGELKPQWLLLTVGNAGLLEFVFGAANSAHPQAGCYDWIMWRYSPNSCTDIFNNKLAPIRCNWNGTCGGGTGIASPSNQAVFGGNAADFEAPLPVNACEQFLICISNYSGVNTLVSFQSLGTASLSCNPNCNPNYVMCYGSTATIVPVNYASLTSPTYSLEPGSLTNSTGSFVVSPTVTTTYTTYITGTNASNAVQTLTSASTVTVNPQPTAAPTVTNTTCTSTLNAVNLNLNFNPPGSAPSYTINWSPIPNGTGPLSPTSFTGGIAPGQYNATITTAAGCATTTSFSVNPIPAPAVIVVNPLGSSHTITCFSAVTLTAMNSAYNYTWSSNVAVFNGSIAVFSPTMAGTWTLTAQDPTSTCVATKTFVIWQNTITPVGMITPTLQNITCNINSITNVTATASPSVNITHKILSPQGGTFSAQSYSTIYTPGGIGIYTYCVVNDANGCVSCNTFTVTSNLSFPTYSVISPENFTLGCNSRSVANIYITNGNAGGSAISYTLIGPATSSNVIPGILSGTNVYSVNVPGTWTVITRNNTSFCETRTSLSVLSNTFAPDISAIVPRTILDCYVPKVTLKGESLTNNVSYTWLFPGTPGTLQSDTIQVSTVSATPNNSVIANYTLTITDNNSTCQSFSVVPMLQNLYPPLARASNGGNPALTCKIYTIDLVNLSSTNIPPATGFPYKDPVVAYLWEGPSPQVPIQLKSSYIAAVAGTYTLTVKDINNGCTSQTLISIGDNRIYPSVNKPSAPPAFTLDCGASSRTISPYVSDPTTGFTFSWTAAPGASVSGQETPILTTNRSGSYRVLITNTLNGCSSLGLLEVVDGSLQADFEANPSKGFAPLSVTFYNNSKSSLGPSNVVSYWSLANNTKSITTHNELSLVSNYTQPGTYKVTMFATKGTCIDSVSKYIEVEIPSAMEIPNVFTPNGDNVNDLFFLKASNLEEITLYIYDRWGHVVYYSVSNTGNIEWNGKNKAGKDMAEGTYFYVIKATGKDGSPYDKKGSLSLYR